MMLINNLAFNLIVISKNESGAAGSPFLITCLNEQAAELLGYSKTELAGQPLCNILTLNLNAGSAPADFLFDENILYEGELLGKNRQEIRTLFSVSQNRDAQNEHILLFHPVTRDSNLFWMRRVVEQSASAIMVTDRGGKIIYANPKFSELTGYTENELLGNTPRMLQSGNLSAEDYQTMWAVLINSGEWRGEIQNRHKNGKIYWVFESISAIKNSSGEISHFVAVEEDITRRKEAEAALQESEERFRQMAEMTGEWLWEQDPSGFYSYSSSAVKQILGYTPSQIIGRHYTEFLTSQDKKAQQQFENSASSYFALMNHYQHKDGHPVLAESTGTPIINAEGKLIKWRGVDRDITARIHFQEALVESEKRNRLIIESSINAIVLMDSYGLITDWNQRAEEMFGWSRGEAVGQRLDELIIPARFRNAHRVGLGKFLRSGKSLVLNKQTEQIALRRDGKEFPVEVSVSPLKIGNTFIFSGFIHDISARKAAEQIIREAHINLAIARNEIKIAQQIQASLSPSKPLETQDFKITGVCLTAGKAGGDYFDYYYRHEKMLDMVIADVSGHAIGSALFMVETRSALRVQTHIAANPARILSVLNNFLFTDLDKSDFFITLFYLQVDMAERQIKFASAGHPKPLLLSGQSKEIIELDADGLILGVRKDVVFEEKTIPLNPGDTILFYTDGLTEAENPEKEFFGLERVKSLFQKHGSYEQQILIDSLLAELQQFCRRTAFDDDITLMVFRVK